MAPNSARGRLALPADSLWLGGLGGVAPIRCGSDSPWLGALSGVAPIRRPIRCGSGSLALGESANC